jgi:DNA-binding NtrC family response regulator
MFGVPIPPLRERPADIVPLNETFLQEIGKSFGRTSARLTRDARTALLEYDWPGNVRELRNAWSGQRLSVMARSSTRTIWPSIPQQNDIGVYTNIYWRIEFHHCVLEDAGSYGSQVLVLREYCSERRNELEVLSVDPPGCLNIRPE